MKFSRLHLILILIGLAATGAGSILFLLNMQQDFIATDQYEMEIRKISGNYRYAPIEKMKNFSNHSGGLASAFTEKGEIRVNINTSNIEELDRLPGIGPSAARRILAHRLLNGPFTSLNELADIKGIGQKTITKIGNIAYIGEPEQIDPSQMEELDSSPISKKEPQNLKIENVPCGAGRININTASAEELQTLPRVGEKTAARIIADRETNGPFNEISDFTRVRGIGPKTLEKMKDLICAE